MIIVHVLSSGCLSVSLPLCLCYCIFVVLNTNVVGEITFI